MSTMRAQFARELAASEIRIWMVLGENQNPVNDFKVGHHNMEDMDEMVEEARVRMNKMLG